MADEFDEQLRFKVITGPMVVASAEESRKPVVSCTASSSVLDLNGNHMTEQAIASMAEQAMNRMTVFLNHSYEVPEDVFGSVVSAKVVRRAGDDGEVLADLDLDIEVDETNERAQKVLSQIRAGRKLGVSIGCLVSDWEPMKTEKGRAFRINEVQLLEASIVGIPANRRSWVREAVAAIRASLVRARRQPTLTAEEWDTKYVNDLPDSAFACIEPGGKKDSEGKTVPRSLRHYPHHDKSGKLDLPHLRNALARIADESNIQCGRSHLLAHAKEAGIGREEKNGFAVLLDSDQDLWQYVDQSLTSEAALAPEIGLPLDGEGSVVAESEADEQQTQEPQPTTEAVENEGEPSQSQAGESSVETDEATVTGAVSALREQLDEETMPLLDALVAALETGASSLRETRKQVEELRKERDELRRMLTEAIELVAKVARLPIGRKATYTSYVNSFRQQFAGVYPDELLALLDERIDHGS